MTSLKSMTHKELKQYILENRNNKELVDAAIQESLSRPGWTTVSADTPLENKNLFLKIPSNKINKTSLLLEQKLNFSLPSFLNKFAFRFLLV